MLTTATETETAKFIDTKQTIQHRGQTYQIYSPPADEHRAESPYILRKGDRWWAMCRNVHPKCLSQRLLFGVGIYGASLKCLPGWFSDKTGALVSLG